MAESTNRIILDDGTDELEFACNLCGDYLFDEKETECFGCGAFFHPEIKDVVMTPSQFKEKFKTK